MRGTYFFSLSYNPLIPKKNYMSWICHGSRAVGPFVRCLASFNVIQN